jgi:glycosyltransferase involved in cell wall biosynthesis
MATVSVVIPCFNYGRYVEDAVQSALSQTGVDVEVIVVDDASTDSSAAVVGVMAVADPRIRLLRHRVNQGPVATFNDGLAVARGEFLVRLDADDLLTPGSLARSVDVCRRHPGVGLVYGRPVHFTGEPPRARQRVTGHTVWHGRDWLEDRCRSGVNVITSPEAFMRMSVVRAVGGQRPLAHTHDLEMWLRIAAVSDVAYVEGADQAWHREHPASLSVSSADPLGLTMLRERRAAFDTLFADPVVGPRLDPRLAALAHDALAAEALTRACYEYDRGRAPDRCVDPLVRFARETSAGCEALPQWHALARRTAADRSWLQHRPWVRLAPLRRIAEDRRRARRWRRTGLYEALRPATGTAAPAHDAPVTQRRTA